MAQTTRSLKIGWLRPRCGWFALLVAAPALGAPTILVAGGQWAAIDFGSRCEARSAGLWAKSDTEPYAGFGFDGGARRQGQFYAHLSKPARAGASVIATIGSEPFLLAGKGDWAWSRTGGQRNAMLEAARYGQRLKIESRDQRGRRFVDYYALDGAPTAIDAAAAACAGKTG